MKNVSQSSSLSNRQASESMTLVINDSKGQREIVLNKDWYTIGRSKSCSIQVIGPFVSRFHARLIRVSLDCQRTYFLILDGNSESQPSKNGLFLDGKRVRNRMLKVGDTLSFGNHAFALIKK